MKKKLATKKQNIKEVTALYDALQIDYNQVTADLKRELKRITSDRDEYVTRYENIKKDLS